MQKQRNPFAKIIKKSQYKLQVIKPKRGKGSYKRKDRANKVRSFLLGAGKVLTIAVPKHPRS